jgi:ketosteroid isomerase-like protein
VSATPSGTNAGLIRSFYGAVAGRDGDAVAALVAGHFAENATLRLPGSLPYGGNVEGRRRLERVFRAAADATAPVGPTGLQVLDIVEGGDRCAVQLRFDWHAPSGGGVVPGTGAVELWTFDGGLVTDITAYYSDTAACVAALAPAREDAGQVTRLSMG